MYRNFFSRQGTQSQRSSDSVLRIEREDHRHQEEAYLQRIMQLEREVEWLRASQQWSINGDNRLRRVDPRNNLNAMPTQAYVNAVNDLIQLNQMNSQICETKTKTKTMTKYRTSITNQ